MRRSLAIITASYVASTYSDVAFFPPDPPIGVPKSFWRLPCRGQSGIARVDPIMYPGVISPHVHSIFGGNGMKTSLRSNRLASESAGWLIVVLQVLDFMPRTTHSRHPLAHHAQSYKTSRRIGLQS